MEFINRIYESIELHSSNNAFCINDKYHTYGDLGKLVSGIRQLIQVRISENEKLIGLVTNDDLETYASIIALWMEGKAYVPVNPIYPIDRNLQILELTESSFILDSTNISSYTNHLQVIKTDQIEQTNIRDKPKAQKKTDLAYILFTSGSTGVPKGVPITFENLNGLIVALDNDNLFKLKPSDRCLQMFELTFDFSLVTYLPPLLFGACVYTIPKDAIKYLYIYKLIETHKLTVLTMVPSIIHYLRPYFNEINSLSVRYCSFGGGKLHADIAAEWSSCFPNCEVFNYYGPTEFTVYSGYYPYHRAEHTKNEKGIVSIGKPLTGVSYLLVDEENNEVNQGSVGELCLAGVQLTPGYWKNKLKNEVSFFIKMENGLPTRYYKTGDLCFLDHEGDYMYIGRADFQVKIRGYRVELAEIEFHAKQLILHTEIIAIDITNKLGNTELAIAIVADEFDTNNLISYLKEKLPAYMLPTQLQFFKELPHSLNGKIDRAKLRQAFEQQIN